ncbi:MAG: hypothetical protein LBH01_12140 [Verrucomicrobiales bacterium]|jgi:hypothetical protein|nr:hypothetical protein [Verrucomicrobiales bacterium]
MIGKAKFPQQRKPLMATPFLPFIPEIAERVVSGDSTATTRWLQHPFYPKPGQEFEAHCNHVKIEGKYLCTGRRRMKLEAIQRLYYKEIGLDAPFTFPELWTRIIGSGRYDPELSCYYYEFRRLE